MWRMGIVAVREFPVITHAKYSESNYQNHAYSSLQEENGIPHSLEEEVPLVLVLRRLRMEESAMTLLYVSCFVLFQHFNTN